MTSAMPLRPSFPWKDRQVLLGVSGGIAAYKSVQLARDLTRLGAEVDVVMTQAATRFVTPLTFQGVTGRPVFTDLWGEAGEGTSAASLHLQLGYEADAVCVAPATADLIARTAHGRSNDLLSTVLLVARAPVVICPAMNDRMFGHPQVQANLVHLSEKLGYHVAGPAVGPLAAGEGDGPGRMIEPSEIVQHIGRALGGGTLLGRTALVTAGPTLEPLDPVRYLGNRSSGLMGYALAQAAWRRGAEVVLVSGPTSLPDPPGVETVRVTTAREMEAVVRRRLPAADLAFFAAAVADYRPAEVRDHKVKKATEGDRWSVHLETNPDVAKDTRDARKKGAYVVGFALETENLEERARSKLDAKGFDLVVANTTGNGVGFESPTNKVTLITRHETRALHLLPKSDVAEEVLDRVEDAILGGVDDA